MNLFSQKIGVDLGTANILVYVKGKGIILNEPSVVAVSTDNNDIIAIGEEAKTMIGKTPGNIKAIRPLRSGVISNFQITEKMLKYFIKKILGKSSFFKPEIMICVPSGVTDVEKRAVMEAATEAGGKKIYLIEEPIAAAIGAGLDIGTPEGKMIIDIGGGTTDIAVISLGTIVNSVSVKIAGDKFDEEIILYLRKIHRLYIGEKTAESIKKNIAIAYPTNNPETFEVKGRDLITSLPKTIKISSDEMLEALNPSLDIIIAEIKKILEYTPPEIIADISTNGIYLSGGGGLLKGLDKRIKAEIGTHVIIAEDALNCVATGTGIALDNLDKLNSNTFVKQS